MANPNGNDDLNNLTKPVFLTKAQREQLALQRRQDQVSQQKQQTQPPPSQHHHSDRDRDRDLSRHHRRKSHTKKAAGLDKSGYRVTNLHGGKSQDQREISLDGFRAKRNNVLVVTQPLPSDNIKLVWKKLGNTFRGEVRLLSDGRWNSLRLIEDHGEVIIYYCVQKKHDCELKLFCVQKINVGPSLFRCKPKPASILDDKKYKNPSSLHEDLIYEILSRLSVKTLSRFKSVCKSWLSLISTSSFIKTHLSRSTNDPHYTHHRLIFCQRIPCHCVGTHTEPWTASLYSLLNESKNTTQLFVDERLAKKNILDQSRESRIRKYRNMSDDEPITDWLADDFCFGDFKVRCVVGYCHGLVCLTCTDESVYLWNPATKKARKLPHLQPRNIKIMHERHYGFCYDELNDAFKVYAVFYDYYENHEASVYSSKSDCWTEIGDFPFGHVSSSKHQMMFANGALYRVVVKRSDDYEESHIISLDINTEMYREILRPVYREGESQYDWVLGTFGKSLSLLCKFDNRADLWVLKICDGEEFWTKLFTIPYMDRLKKYKLLKPICISMNGDIMLQFGSTILLYNSKDNTFKDLEERNVYNDLQYKADVYTYVESLVSP